MKIVSSVFICTLFLLSSPAISSGQSLTPQTLSQNFNVSVKPQHPGPEEVVTITLDSFSNDTESLFFRWTLDGTQQLEGTGRNSFTFTTGPLGSSHRVSAFISGSGVSTSKNFSFEIGGVDLIVEAQTYTPPFYKGKALPSLESNVIIYAIENISGATSNSLYYTWKQDGKVLGSASGLGRSSLVIPDTRIVRPKNIEVSVGRTSSSVSATQSITITPSDSLVFLYEDSPLYGTLYNKALQTTSLEQPEATFVAEPYFFSSVANLYPNIDFSWRLNGNLLDTVGNSLTLRREDASNTNIAVIDIKAENISSILESALSNFRVQY